MERSNFTFYESFAAAAKRIKKKSERCDFYDAIVSYALYGEEQDMENMPDMVAIAIELIKPNLDSSRRKAENGKQSGKPKANGKQTESKNDFAFANGESKNDFASADDESKNDFASPDDENKKEKEIEKEIENKKENEKEIEGESEGETRKAAKKKRDVFEEFAASDKELLKALRDFEQMRVKIKKPLTDRAKEMIIDKLKTFPPDQWVQILEQSVMHDWQGLFGLKSEKKYSPNDFRNISNAKPDVFLSPAERKRMLAGHV